LREQGQQQIVVLGALPNQYKTPLIRFVYLKESTMKRIALVMLLVMFAAGIVSAANVPAGITGLWRFENEADRLNATVGADLVTSNPSNPGWMTGPWTIIEPGLSDGGIIQDHSWDYLSCYHGIAPNGGGDYINEYTIAVDFYAGGGAWNSLYQTAWNGNSNDGDLWIDATDTTAATIGVSPVGYSTQTFDATKWHRIVWSVDNGNFFRAYVDGALYLDGAGQPIDGRFSLELDRFNLFADNDWEDAWCMAGTVAVWDRALTTEEIAPMGGWLNGSFEPTPLTVPEPSTFVLLAAGLAMFFVIRKRK
jgi:hypothetical protein